MEKVDQAEGIIEKSEDEDTNDEENYGTDDDDDDVEDDDGEYGNIGDSEDDVGESNPLLVDPEKDTDEDTKVKLWFGKVRIIN